MSSFSISWVKNRRQEWPKCRLSPAAGYYFEPCLHDWSVWALWQPKRIELFPIPGNHGLCTVSLNHVKGSLSQITGKRIIGIYQSFWPTPPSTNVFTWFNVLTGVTKIVTVFCPLRYRMTLCLKSNNSAHLSYRFEYVATARKLYSCVFVYNSITFHYYQMLLFLCLFLSEKSLYLSKVLTLRFVLF